ncbi:Helix-turn-helix domain [Mycobacteroides abscessus subsp. abscessus]|nr:Helix-turn-helix domain [Mycobacteroides abscessus subsp. abscessus]
MIAGMSPEDVAELLDVKPNTIRKAMRRTGMRLRIQKHKGIYRLTDSDIDQLCQILNKKRLRPVEDIDTDGFPPEWLGDPSHTPAFIAERFRRERRLLELIRKAGLAS